MTRRLWIVLVTFALLLGVVLGAGSADAQRRSARSQRVRGACPNVIPENETCTRFGQGRSCRYGRNSTCVCRRRGARQPLRWYCTP